MLMLNAMIQFLPVMSTLWLKHLRRGEAKGKKGDALERVLEMTPSLRLEELKETFSHEYCLHYRFRP